MHKIHLIRFESLNFSGKTPLVNDLLKIDVTESLISGATSLSSMAVIPSGPGLSCASRLLKMDLLQKQIQPHLKVRE